MKLSLRRILCLAFGLVAAHAPVVFAQDLEFHPVPRPAATSPAAASRPDPVTPGGIVPASFVAGKIVDDTLTYTQEPMKTPEPLRVNPVAPVPAGPPVVGQPGDLGMPRMMPPGPGVVFNQPTMIGQPGIVTQPTIVSQPTIVGTPTIISHGGMPSMVSGGDCGSCGSSCGSCGNSCDSCSLGLLRGSNPLFGQLFNGGNWGSRSTCEPACCDPCGVSCAPTCCDPCGTCNCCGPRSMFWVRGEYLHYATSRQNGPPLVTTAPTVQQLGLGAGSTVVYDSKDLPRNFDGGKLNIGFWFPNHPNWGLDITGFALNQRSSNFFLQSDGTPGSIAIGRPYTEQRTDAVIADPRVAEITAGPGPFGGAGSIAISSQTRIFGLDPNLRFKLACGQNWWVDGLVGYRYFHLSDDLSINEDIRPNTPLVFGQRIQVFDQFNTTNTFNGVQLGLDGEWHFMPRWALGGTFKFAAGNLAQQIHINGTSVLQPVGGAPMAFPGGFFAVGSNIGNFNRNQFSVLPELGLKVSFDMTDHLRLYAGYNVMYLANVVRAADQIDPRVNSSQAPPPGVVVGPALPAVLFKRSDFWAHGANVGLEYHW